MSSDGWTARLCCVCELNEDFAKSAGYPGVFAQGMFTAGVLATFLTNWVGESNVRRFRTRFVGQVWPGEQIVCTAKVSAVNGDSTLHAGDQALRVLGRRYDRLRQERHDAVVLVELERCATVARYKDSTVSPENDRALTVERNAGRGMLIGMDVGKEDGEIGVRQPVRYRNVC